MRRPEEIKGVIARFEKLESLRPHSDIKAIVISLRRFYLIQLHWSTSSNSSSESNHKPATCVRCSSPADGIDASRYEPVCRSCAKVINEQQDHPDHNQSEKVRDDPEGGESA